MYNAPTSGFIPAPNRKPPPQAPDKKTPPPTGETAREQVYQEEYV
ncbi:hypothetical protein MAE02_71570 [Microvirga aerophila]|uniref:Uncharacterized protein n=1 Tax=Microvirga aerophila TaxID=670291 RepID=A0A512C5I6_9HYPH|nr:hypothetical protein MAE02_71570 [Microvirga aerophila]